MASTVYSHITCVDSVSSALKPFRLSELSHTSQRLYILLNTAPFHKDTAGEARELGHGSPDCPAAPRAIGPGPPHRDPDGAADPVHARRRVVVSPARAVLARVRAWLELGLGSRLGLGLGSGLGLGLAVYAPRMLTDGAAGSRWSLSQHLVRVRVTVRVSSLVLEPAPMVHRVAASIT